MVDVHVLQRGHWDTRSVCRVYDGLICLGHSRVGKLVSEATALALIVTVVKSFNATEASLGDCLANRLKRHSLSVGVISVLT